MLTKTEEHSIWENGYDACVYGYACSTNPYNSDSEEHECWETGWYAADFDRSNLFYE